MSLTKKFILLILLCMSNTNSSLYVSMQPPSSHASAPIHLTSKTMHGGQHRSRTKKITIMIDASGDALQTGRKVDDRYERSITLQCANELKQLCIAAFKDQIHVVITRTAGYTRTEFDSAQLANRLNADLFIFLGAYQQHEGSTMISLYQFSLSPHFVPHGESDMTFIPYDQAYRKAFNVSNDYGTFLKKELTQQEYQRIFTAQGVYAIPYKPLLGIQVPAIGIELGLHHGADGKLLINPLAKSLIHLIQKIYDDEQNKTDN